MEISDLLQYYGRHSQMKAFSRLLADESLPVVHVEGLKGSAAPVWFGCMAQLWGDVLRHPVVFILRDEEEAGYFYQYLVQLVEE